jgi:glycosyltransferase involved in cell wall biosynthesis
MVNKSNIIKHKPAERNKICFLAAASSIHTKQWAEYFIKRGDDVHILTFHPADMSFGKIYNLRSYFMKPRPLGGNWQYLSSLREVRYLLRKIKPDLVNAHYLTSYGLLAALSGLHPLVITVHGSDIKITPHKNFIYRHLAKFALRQADLIFSVAEHISKDIYGYGIDRQKVVTIQYGICPHLFNLKSRHSSSYELVTTRRLEPVSNYKTILDCMAIIKLRRPQTKLLIIGDGTLKNQLFAYAMSLDLQNNVVFLGEVSQEEIARGLKGARIYISVSHSDGTPLSVFEAMACGTVPIVSDIPANREWISEGENGFYVDKNSPQDIAKKILDVLSMDNEVFDKIAHKNSELISRRMLYSNNMAKIAGYFYQLMRLYRKSGGEGHG